MRLIRWFDEIGIEDVPLVGGKNASLGEMYRELTPQGREGAERIRRHGRRLPVLPAPVRGSTADCARSSRAWTPATLRTSASAAARLATRSSRPSLPDDLEQAIVDRLREALGGQPEPLDVAVRSSATAEDLPDASFAGQQETYLNVQGSQVLLETCKRCFASLFTDRAISYRVDKGFDHFKIALSIGVQRMVRSDLAASGVMFSIDTETGFRDAVLINAAYGLGENVVQGSVNPDEYYVFKPTLKQGFRPILQKTLGTKEFKLVYDVGGGKMTKNVPVPPEDRDRFAHRDDEILHLARWAVPDRGPLQRQARSAHARWTWNGPRTGGRASCSSCRRAPRPSSRRRRADTIESLPAAVRGRGARQRPQRRREDRPGTGARDQAACRTCSSSATAKSWSPTRPIPTGSRS